jgi:hypothetical protein
MKIKINVKTQKNGKITNNRPRKPIIRNFGVCLNDLPSNKLPVIH